MFFFKLREVFDTEWIQADGSIVGAHQDASGSAGGQPRAIGYSVAGPSSKIHMVADSIGLPVYFEITGGEVHDSQVAKQLLDNSGGGKYFVADKGYDSQEIRNYAEEKGYKVVIPRRKNSHQSNESFDPQIYKKRHRIENLFQKLKRFRSIETRFDKLARNFSSITCLACIIICLRAL